MTLATTRTGWMTHLRRRLFCTAAARPGTGIVMMNMGGPESLEEVGPFLHNLFTDTDIIEMPLQRWTAPLLASRRTPRVQKLYEAIGGCSPITRLTRLQAEKTMARLDELSPSTAPHRPYIAFRYAGPTVSQALDQMKVDGIQRAVAFSQYPQFSCTTTGSSFNHLWKTLKEKGLESAFSWSVLDRWPTHPAFIRAVTTLVRRGLQQLSESVRQDAIILFSAHSLPLRTVFKGDQYPAEVAATVYAVMESLGFSHRYMLTWQSQVGRIPWLEPQTDKVLEDLGRTGRSTLIVPIAFTTDHIETLSEIDIEFKEVAEKAGIKEYVRAPSLNDEPEAIEAFAQIVRDHLHSQQLHSLQYKFRCPGCTKPLCRSVMNPVSGCSVGPLRPVTSPPVE